MAEFAALAAEHAASLDDSYSVPCDWALVEELKKTSSTGQGTLRLAEILLNDPPFAEYLLKGAAK